MIKYVIRAKKSQIDKAVRYYPQMAPTAPLSLAQIIKRVEKRSALSPSNVEFGLQADITDD